MERFFRCLADLRCFAVNTKVSLLCKPSRLTDVDSFCGKINFISSIFFSTIALTSCGRTNWFLGDLGAAIKDKPFLSLRLLPPLPCVVCVVCCIRCMRCMSARWRTRATLITLLNGVEDCQGSRSSHRMRCNLQNDGIQQSR